MVTTTQSITDEGQVFDFDGLMNKLMLMRAINRPSLTDVMVAPVGQTWHGTKPNGTPWVINKINEKDCQLVITS